MILSSLHTRETSEKSEIAACDVKAVTRLAIFVISNNCNDSQNNVPSGPHWNQTYTRHGRSYVAKTTEQLEHALATMDATGVELRAVEVVGDGMEGSAAFDREVERVRSEVGLF